MGYVASNFKRSITMGGLYGVDTVLGDVVAC